MLTVEEKIKLVNGVGNWHTNGLDGRLESIQVSDGPHGLRAQSESAKSNNDSIPACCFPTASAIACSFDRELVGKMATAIAEEAIEAGVSVVLGPGVNMKRSPACGRNFEYFSEDPYLAGELAISYVREMQKKGVGTSLKHFAGNSQETHRMTSNSMIEERALREIYLRAFEKVVKEAKPATIMASYNYLNGKPACENEWLLTTVLRKEWGYEGLVMSDWGACVDAPACLQAGMDLEMPDSLGNHRQDLEEAFAAGILTEQALDRAAQNVITLVKQYPRQKATGRYLLDVHHELSRRLSAESAVLLKNEGILPLKNPKKVYIFGELAKKMRIQGGGSSHIHTQNVPNILEAFAAAGVEAVYCENVDMLRKADAPVIVFGGLTDEAEGEGYDRVSLKLPEKQRKQHKEIQALMGETGDLIYVSFGGSPYEMELEAKACLCMYLGGEGVAEACVDLLLGKENPSGRLAETWPLRLEDTPCYDNFGRQNKTPNDVKYEEGIFVGYRYYDTNQVSVRYPFGYGLSYTTFAYNNLVVGKEISVEVTNTGNCAGKETVLLFVKNPEGYRAQRELRGFEKVSLAPGETKKVTIALDDRAFQVYEDGYKTIGGEYTIEISRSVGDVILFEKIQVEGEAGSLKKGVFEMRYEGEITDFSHVKPGQFTEKNSLSQMAPYSKRARVLLKIGGLAARLITKAPLTDPEAMMIYEGISEGNIDSVCNQSRGLISKKEMKKIITSANKEGRK